MKSYLSSLMWVVLWVLAIACLVAWLTSLLPETTLDETFTILTRFKVESIKKEYKELEAKKTELETLKLDLEARHPGALILKSSEDDKKTAAYVNRAADTDVEASRFLKQANEKYATEVPWVSRFLLKNDYLYDSRGRKQAELLEDQGVRVNHGDCIKLPGFSENLVFAVIMNSDRTETRGYIRVTSISGESKEELEKRLLRFGQWVDVRSNDTSVVFEKAVTLRPGEASQPLVQAIYAGGKYDFFRADKSVNFTAWINGQEVKFGSFSEKLPYISDVLNVRVQLGHDQSRIQTIRLRVTKTDKA